MWWLISEKYLFIFNDSSEITMVHFQWSLLNKAAHFQWSMILNVPFSSTLMASIPFEKYETLLPFVWNGALQNLR